MRRIVLAAVVAALAARSAESGDLDPSLGDTAERTDPGKTVSLTLPTAWKELGRSTAFASLQTWSGSFEEPTKVRQDVIIDVRLESGWSRAELAWWANVRPWWGERDEGSVRRGEGWVEEVRSDAKAHTKHLYRFVAQAGRVYLLDAETHEERFPRVEKHIRAVFDTIRSISTTPLLPPPAGYVVSSRNGVSVVTDTKDAKALQHVLGEHAAAWKVMTQVLPGERAIADPPVVVVCEKDQAYSDITLPTAQRFAVGCDMIPEHRIVIARVSGLNVGAFDYSLRRFAALQYTQYFFGGGVPSWVERGLAAFPVAAMGRGRPDKPPVEFLVSAKSAAAAAGGSLHALIAVRWADLDDKRGAEFDMAAYAWHCFFRFGSGAKTYGARYQRYIDELRRTGAPDDALKAWDDVDREALSRDFLAWIAAWKP